MIREFAGWIGNTALSQLLQNLQWIVPLSQSLHIVGLSVLFGAAVALNLRILGALPAVRPVAQMATALTPWVWRAFSLVLVTGLVQTIAEPLRQFVTPVFWIKMGLIVAVVALTTQELRRARSAEAIVPRGIAIASLVLWTAIMICGRMIGYTYGFYL